MLRCGVKNVFFGGLQSKHMLTWGKGLCLPGSRTPKQGAGCRFGGRTRLVCACVVCVMCLMFLAGAIHSGRGLARASAGSSLAGLAHSACPGWERISLRRQLERSC